MKNNKLKKIICAALLCSTFAVPYMGSVEAAKAPDVKAEAQQTEKSQQEMQAKLTALEGKLKAVEADKTGETNTAAIKEITEELKELHKQMESSAVAQSRIMEALDDVQYKNQEMEKFMADPSDGYYGTAATEKYLVYPGGNGSTPSYTQDAINAQGNSTMIFAYAPNQLYKIYCRRGYLTDLAFHKGENIKFLGAVDFYTKASSPRMIGNIVYSTDLNGSSPVAAFENHSGKTYLGKGVEPLGKVIKGFGNNGEDGGEGARYKNVFATYGHGPLLPKNPIFCDSILLTALKAHGVNDLRELDDSIENAALKNALALYG